jgi:hypothetical protein
MFPRLCLVPSHFINSEGGFRQKFKCNKNERKTFVDKDIPAKSSFPSPLSLVLFILKISFQVLNY